MKKVVSLVFKLLLIVWLVAISVFAAWFVSENGQPVQASLVGFSFPQATLAAYLMITLILGVIVGSVFTFVVMQNRLFANKRHLKKARKEVDKLKVDKLKEVNSLPAAV